MSGIEEKKSEATTGGGGNNGNNDNRQYVWIVRYGLTEHPLVENVGPYDSDIHPIEGVTHAQAIANRLLLFRNKPNVVYADPFLRCTHTAHIIASTLSIPLCIEEGLTEWQTPSLLVNARNNTMTHPQSVETLKKRFDSIDDRYRSVNPEGGSGKEKGAPKFQESVQDLKIRCGVTMDKLLAASSASSSSSEKNMVIVSHAPCNQMLAHYLFSSSSSQSSSSNTEDDDDDKNAVVGPWSLGGITCFSRLCLVGVGNKEKEGCKYGEWTCEYFSDTTHMPGEYRDGVKGRWSLPDFE